MSKSKHFIGKIKADRLIENMKEAKKPKRNPYAELPLAFQLPVKDIRQLINTPEAVHFVVQFGLKISTVKGEDVKTIAPVMCVADINKVIIQSPPAIKLAKTLEASDEINTAEGKGGGYLDEIQNWP
jgi:hypothetical protein